MTDLEKEFMDALRVDTTSDKLIWLSDKDSVTELASKTKRSITEAWKCDMPRDLFVVVLTNGISLVVMKDFLDFKVIENAETLLSKIYEQRDRHANVFIAFMRDYVKKSKLN